MTVTRITRVSGGRRPPESEPLVGSALDMPQAGAATNDYRIDLEGWALGRQRPMTTVEVFSDSYRIAKSPIDWNRPDLSRTFPDQPWAGAAGFRTSISLLGIVGDFRLAISSRTQEGDRHALGSVEGHRQPLPSDPDQEFNLVLVSTHGRTGSSWLMHILGKHPDILAFRPFEHEARIASFWLSVLDTLTDPSSYLQQVSTLQSGRHWWLGDGSVPGWAFDEPALNDWLDHSSSTEAIRFCRERVKHFYARMYDGQDAPRYVAEKMAPNRLGLLARDVFSGTRELVMVRDFRDMLCSMIAYSERDRSRHFAYGEGAQIEKYIEQVRDYAASLQRVWERRSNDAFLVRYEDLVSEPAQCSANIFEYLGIDHSAETVEDVLSAAAVETSQSLQHRTVSNATRSIGRWRRDLSPDVQEACANTLGDALEAFGYPRR